MKFALEVFGMRPGELSHIAAHSERLGFDTIWLGDHLITPLDATSRHPFGVKASEILPPNVPLLDPWAAISHMAAHTSRIRFGTRVFILALRHPMVTARAAATAQDLSQGRVMLGVGGGWLAEEFDAMGVDFRTRGALMDEALDVLEALWSGKPVSHDGTFFKFGSVHFGEAPIHVPLLVGGLSRVARRRAASRGEGWIASGPITLSQLIEARREIEAVRERLGRDGLPFEYHVPLNGPRNRATVQRYEDAGFTNVTLEGFLHWRGEGGRLDLTAKLAGLERIAEALGVSL